MESGCGRRHLELAVLSLNFPEIENCGEIWPQSDFRRIQKVIHGNKVIFLARDGEKATLGKEP